MDTPFFPVKRRTRGRLTLEIFRSRKKGSETLVMVGTVGSIFHDFVAEQIPVSQVVWRDEVRPAPMTEEIRKDDQLPWYYVAENGNHGLSGAVVVPGLNEMMKNIEARARRKEKLPRV
jgi:hypothetical protein